MPTRRNVSSCLLQLLSEDLRREACPGRFDEMGIAALHPSYVLTPSFWKKIEPVPFSVQVRLLEKRGAVGGLHVHAQHVARARER